jgi:hypothetical protein
LAISAVDSITLAIEHTKQQLFSPFRIGQWTRLAFVGLLAGELGVNGCNRSNFQAPGRTGAPSIGFPGTPGIDHALLAALLGSALIAALAVGIILLYVGSVMRFVLFDSIILRECHIRWEWSRRLGPGWGYFGWRFIYFLLAMAGMAVVFGVPLAFAFTKGWFKHPNDHLLPLVAGGIVLFLALLIFLVATAVILVLTKDFVVPQMALENIGVMEGWRRLWPMMKAEKGAYTGYIVMKIVLAIVATILIGIATVFIGLIFVVPTAGFSILAVLTGKAAGLTWNTHTIALAAAVGCVLLATFLYIVSLVSVPAIVFFPAYSVHFFAARYPRLRAALYSAPATPGAPARATAPV